MNIIPDRLLSRLSDEFPGTVVFGRYSAPQGKNAMTARFGEGEPRNWENRAKMRMRLLCFVWEEANRGFRVEYRRTPAQIYAERFIETTGFDEASHQRVREILLEEEWACRPRFEWVTKMGLYWIFSFGALVVFLLLGQGIWYISFGEALSMDALPVFLRALFVEVAIMLIIGVVFTVFRGYYFPSGILRIDEEAAEQERRDRGRLRLAKLVVLALVSLVVGLLARISHQRQGGR